MSNPTGEAHAVRNARNDAAYALIMAQRPEVTRLELCALVEKLAGHVREVARVAEARGQRLNAPAARALEEALRAAVLATLGQERAA
ncbi:hypothetical protein [Streptomyces sp. CA-106110]|uniref:hypothetical protein n=1 Tax=Streptomyces sp. CA-106110 TaxID=3240044 RepID=UPI003D89FF23